MVTIVVEGNAAPIAQDDSSAPNQPLGQSVTVDILANDNDPEDKLDPTSVKIVDPSGEPVTTLVVVGEGTWVVNPTTGAITFTPEAGFTNDPTAITYTVSDQAGNTSNAATVSIDYEEAAAITGVVWVDANQNGLVDAGEERKAGWTLKIKDADGNVVATTVTDADGNYSITGLIPAVYTVEFYDAEGTLISSQRTNGSLVAGQSMTVPLPLEPVVNANPDLDDNSILLSKSVNKQQISVGDQLYYTIRAENLTEDEIVFDINDNLPTGFKLASTNVKLTHAGADGTFGTDDDTYPAITTTGIDPVRFKAITLGQSEKAQVGYLVKVGTAAPQGSSVNTAQAFAAGSMTDIASNIATASVETIADTVIDQATLIGKVFHDRDGDGYQDSANVTGLTIKSDYFGWNGLNIGELQGRASVLGNPAKYRKVVRMPWSIKNDFEVTTEQGTVVSIDEDGQVRESHTGDKANGLTAQSIQVTTRLTEGVPTPTSIVAMRQPAQVMNVIEITIMNHGIQEEGLPGVRLATVKGLVIETDAYGRYNIPDVNSGSRSMGQNFIIKVDSATLPQGARFTTENPRVLRLTGTALEKINFGVKLAPQRLDQTAEANLKSSFFDAGRDSIKARNLGAMDNIARSIKQYGQGRIIIGLSRQSGLNTEARLDLAKRRAYSVQTYLLERLGHQLMTRVRVEVSTQ
jgi:CshA-type fibril repeat protein